MKIKNFKSTESLYGVKPEYFENMKYFEAIEEKAKLAKKRIKAINEKIDYKLPDNEYQELNEQLVECEKARELSLIRFMQKVIAVLDVFLACFGISMTCFYLRMKRSI